MLTEVSKAANDAGVKSGEMGGFLDKLLVAIQKTGASISSLSSDMYRYGSPLRQVGFGVDETIATLGSFDKAGVNTKLVMGSLRIALGKMAKAGEKDLPAGARQGHRVDQEREDRGRGRRQGARALWRPRRPGHGRRDPRGPLRGRGPHQAARRDPSGAVERTGKATQTFSGKMDDPAQQGDAGRRGLRAASPAVPARSWSPARWGSSRFQGLTAARKPSS